MPEKFKFLLDRMAVLLIGIGVGATIAASFGATGGPLDNPAKANIPSVPAKITPKQECPETLSPRIIAALRENRPIHIGVFGDSFGDGLWAAIYNGLRGNKNLVVHRFAKQATGFTRYQQLNLHDDIKAKIANQPVDIAIISFGANDTQDIWSGKLAPYMSAEWKNTVGGRADEVVTMLKANGAQVYWVGLPKMRKPEFDVQIQAMNQFYNERMCSQGVKFIDTVPPSVDSKGEYNLFLTNPDTGEQIKARAPDGIHMTMTGYGFLIHGLLERLRSYGDAVDKAPKSKSLSMAGGTPHG